MIKCNKIIKALIITFEYTFEVLNAEEKAHAANSSNKGLISNIF